MKYMPFVVIAYALIVLIGGMVGFAKAHSWPSIIMGTITAILLICAAIAMMNNLTLGFFSAAGITFLLSIFFMYRFLQSFHFMPGGLMAIISIATFVILLAAKIKS